MEYRALIGTNHVPTGPSFLELNMPELKEPARRRTRRPSAVIVNAASPMTRLDQQRFALVTCVDLLKRRRADLIPEDDIDDFISRDWLIWDGGSLSLTQTGINICQQARAKTAGGRL